MKKCKITVIIHKSHFVLGSGRTFNFAAVLVESFGKFVVLDSIGDEIWVEDDKRPTFWKRSIHQLANKLRNALDEKKIRDPVVATQKGAYGMFWKVDVPEGSTIERRTKNRKISKKSSRNNRRINEK